MKSISYDYIIVYNDIKIKTHSVYFLENDRILIEDRLGNITAFNKNEIVIIFPSILGGEHKVIKYGQEMFINERKRHKQIHKLNTSTQAGGNRRAFRRARMAFSRKINQWNQ